MDTHFLESTVVDDDGEREAMPLRLPTDEASEMFLEYIDTSKVVKSLRTFRPHKAAGQDGFKPLVLQKLNDEFYLYLTHLYQLAVKRRICTQSLESNEGCFPPQGGENGLRAG